EGDLIGAEHQLIRGALAKLLVKLVACGFARPRPIVDPGGFANVFPVLGVEAEPPHLPPAVDATASPSVLWHALVLPHFVSLLTPLRHPSLFDEIEQFPTRLGRELLLKLQKVFALRPGPQYALGV